MTDSFFTAPLAEVDPGIDNAPRQPRRHQHLM